MGTWREDDGGQRPPGPGDKPEGLPGFPAEWGPVVIPDNAAELDPLAVAVRRRLRWEQRSRRWRRRLGLPATRPHDGTGLGTPLMIMAVAVLITVTSLLAIGWQRPAGPTRSTATPAPAAQPRLPDVTLTATDGTALRVSTVHPAVVLLADGCTCPDLLARLVDVVPAKTPVLIVARTAPQLAIPLGRDARALADPDGTLRAAIATPTTTATALATPPPETVTALVIDAAGTITKTLPTLHTPEDLRPAVA